MATENDFRTRDQKNRETAAQRWFLESRGAWLERPNSLSQDFCSFCKENLAEIWENRNGSMAVQFDQLNRAYMNSAFGFMTEGYM
jgi:hypothetical protein